MGDSARLQICRPGNVAEGVAIDLPELLGGMGECGSQGGQVVGFAEQVGEGEAEVECAVAEVDDFVIEEDQTAFMHEDVFWAVISVNQCLAAWREFGRRGFAGSRRQRGLAERCRGNTAQAGGTRRNCGLRIQPRIARADPIPR